jgi:hypothetical protein
MYNGGWAGMLYHRLSPAERTALMAGQEIVFRPDAPDPDRRLTVEWQRRIMDSWQSHIRLNGQSVLLKEVPNLRMRHARLSLNRMELGQISLSVYFTVYWPGEHGESRTANTVEIATGRSPSVTKPENRKANAALRGSSPFDQIVALRPESSCVTLKAAVRRREPPLPHGIQSAAIGDLTRPHLLTADVWEAVHRETGLPIVADSYTRVHRLDQVTVIDKPLFEALCAAADAMGVRWSKDGDFLLCRSAGYLWDKLKEVPERHLRRWTTSRDANGGLPFSNLLEMASMPDLQMDSRVVAEAIAHCRGLPEWSLLGFRGFRSRARFLSTLSPEQLRRAFMPAGLPFKDLAPAQQQGAMDLQYTAMAEAERQNGEPSKLDPSW